MFSYKSLFALLVVIGMTVALPIGGGGSGSGLPVPTAPGVPTFEIVYEILEEVPSLIPVTLDPEDHTTSEPEDYTTSDYSIE
ncbi:unnamed protein product [Caenorhabditis brenneri]